MSDQNKGTQGPWRAYRVDSELWNVRDEKGYRLSCEVELEKARLIEAAPELLELARSIVLRDMCADIETASKNKIRIPEDIVKAARALMDRLDPYTLAQERKAARA